MLNLYNTFNRELETLAPQQPPIVTLYTCGPTVYDYPHIGNWFAFVRWDLLVRTLKANGYQPKWVMNITDVGHLVSDEDEGEDKLEKGARRENKTAWEIAKFYTDNFNSGMKRLNMLVPDYMPKATEHIKEQIGLIKQLEDRGYTYVISDGVYFDTEKFPGYGKMAKLDLDDQNTSARITHNPEKRNPTDFALWKFSPTDHKRDMEWDSPWGKGFPGWHIECSAMSMKYLGQTLDIHTGGIDHLPVHHTNEVAQSQAATGKQFARVWLHSNHITVSGEKIAKSAGNGITLEDIEAKNLSLMAVKLHVFESHYRSQSKFSWESLEAAANRLRHWQNVAELRWQTYDTLDDDNKKDSDDKYVSLLATPQAVLEALNDDLNTPKALKIIDEAFSQLENHRPSRIDQDALLQLLTRLDTYFGLNLLGSTPDISDEAKQLILERQRVREASDWQKADQIRIELEKQNIAMRDTAHGPIWSTIKLLRV